MVFSYRSAAALITSNAKGGFVSLRIARTYRSACLSNSFCIPMSAPRCAARIRSSSAFDLGAYAALPLLEGILGGSVRVISAPPQDKPRRFISTILVVSALEWTRKRSFGSIGIPVVCSVLLIPPSTAAAQRLASKSAVDNVAAFAETVVPTIEPPLLSAAIAASTVRFAIPTPISAPHSIRICAPQSPPNAGTNEENPAQLRMTYQGDDLRCPRNSPL